MNMSEPTQFRAEGLRGEMLRDEPMSRHASWRAGGVAQRVYQPADLADLQTFLRRTPADEPLLAVGLGSNLLVRDGGFRGTVLLLLGGLAELRREGDLIYAQAGVAGAKLARFAATNHLCGAEFFVGIPGTLGGMLAMNAGCYGGETWQKVVRVQVLARGGELLERAPQEYEIGYRHVALRKANEEFFVGAWLKLEQGDAEAARQQIKALMEKRSASQPLQLPNCGSVFRNPPGDHAARLIESCGLKGKRIGGAQVSEKHANFIVNLGGASAADIEDLIGEVRATVLRQTGVELHTEVRIAGEKAK
ncbi:MAG: UDP-N-acetylmuramate dehydrogenase [Gallionella sp.]|nr:UDP-N-acetylmuramate dehydrogenase [Gallionella sp.]NCS74834.1 UDP-N-acetylmuramate dehydrogenase [Gallionella sp.]PIV47536.1 MAG: UDP-N-acetylenolpyruvoylglucosamine reductase [Gallionellaceae bacterium CG02_land_8_20_14_3_00_60_115]